MVFVKAFVAGFLATLIFHQGLYALFNVAGMVTEPPWNMVAVPPLGVPKVLSLAFFGGLWGIVIWLVARLLHGWQVWVACIVLGAIGPSAVALLVVFPLKGLAVNGDIVLGALLLNAAWGLGLVLLMQLMGERR